MWRKLSPPSLQPWKRSGRQNLRLLALQRLAFRMKEHVQPMLKSEFPMFWESSIRVASDKTIPGFDELEAM